MIKKIICPIDFSQTSNNAVEYAAKLAQNFKVELMFVNVQPLLPVPETITVGGGTVREYIISTSERIKAISVETNRMFNIPTSYQVDITSKSFIDAFSCLGDDSTLMVMGTNGADDNYQYFFGTNTFQVIKKTKCPVLIVPENVTYKDIEQIVFTWDYSSENNFSFSFLSNFVKPIKPKFIFLHVSKHPSLISQDLFKTLKSRTQYIFGENVKLEFEQKFSDNVPATINKYMIESKADLLAITYYDKGFIQNIFRSPLTKDLAITAQYPILVIHN